jgi:hypothetical protein
MAHFRLGDTEQAHQRLRWGVGAIDQMVPSIDGPPVADYPPDRWIVWCMADVVRREAEELIGSQAKEGGPQAPGEEEARE